MALSNSQRSQMCLVVALMMFVLSLQMMGFGLFWAVQRALTSNYEKLMNMSKLASMPCTFNPCAFLEVSIASAPSQRLVLQLYNHKAPNTVKNFKALTTGEKGITSNGIRLHYEGTSINRVLHGLLIQGGDLYGGKDANEEIEAVDASSLEVESDYDIFDKVGLLSLVGSGPSKNGYEFFITVDSAPELNGLHLVFGEDGSVRATRKLQLVHSDVCGPMRTPSVGNSLCFVTFIDDFSRFCWVYPLKAKSDVFAIFQHYVSMVENETGCKVQTLRTDRGGEYMSERKNRSLMEMARCMHKAKSLPHKLWMEAVACAAHVLNRCPTCALKTITPYESWYDRKPSVSYLRVFGCLAYAHIPQQLRGKLDDKAVKCIFVGYSSGSKGYRLYNPATNKIFESRDVIFAETTAQPMVAFDVPHMQTQDVFEGFLSSFVENQESQQVDNLDQSFDQHVTPHDVEEVVREEQEVLREERTLPKWVQKTLQDSKLDAPLPRKTRADKAVCQTDVGDLAIDVQAIHDDVHIDVEHDKLEKTTLSSSTIVGPNTDAIVDLMIVDVEIDGIVNAMEVESSIDTIVNDNAHGASIDAIINAIDDIEIVDIDAIFRDTKDMGEEALTNKGARIGEAILEIDAMAQDKAICQIDVASIAIDLLVVHNSVHTDVEPIKLEKATLSTSITFDVLVVHDCVHTDIEYNKLEMATLSTSTIARFDTNAIVDLVIVDAKTNGIVNAICHLQCKLC
ncbi:hypothetical protein L7F22_068732 [Adiantum nelumboides]|nr:hypothetical protein [Adiantum nelumboides]